MAECVLETGRILDNYVKPYFVAELNNSHFGKLNNAKEMIDAAKEAGCDCVKVQSYTIDSLYSENYFDKNPLAKRMMPRFLLKEEDLRELAFYCREVGIGFSSTPYSEQEVDFLVEECQVPFIKIASMDLDNENFLRYIAKKHIAVVLSTGMSSMEEIAFAVDVLRDSGCKNFCLLHCISVYPPRMEDIQLNNIIGLREAFPDVPIGFSDHSKGYEIAVAATVMGACLIEKHLTLDRSRIGMDNEMAMQPQEMKKMVSSCRHVFVALGTKERIIADEEREQKNKMRRSIVAACDISKDTIITSEMLCAKRPATGIPLHEMKNIIGRKTAMDIKANRIIKKEDILL